ncbi:MAG: ABC transporter permease [Planctomycetota bacterium]
MTGSAYLALRYALHHPLRTGVLAACVAVALALPAGSRAILERFESSLYARARTVPLVVGAKGSRFDLAFSALYFRATDLAPTPYREYAELLDEPSVRAIPVHARFTASGGDVPVVATSIEYLETRGLAPDEGRVFARVGEAVIGSRAAERLGLGVGGWVFSDQRELYDITSPPSVKLDIVGVLGETGTPDDDALIVDLETAWVLEGIAHGHDEAEEIERADLVIGRSEEHVALSGAVVTYQEITDENAASFHLHGPRDNLPLSSILVYPADDKARTIVRTRVDASAAAQAIVPTRVIDDLIAFLLRIRALIDALSAILLLSTLTLIGCIGVLSYRVRAAEIRTLGEIGCARGTVGLMFAFEAGGVLAVAGAVAGVVTLAALGLAEPLMRAGL